MEELGLISICSESPLGNLVISSVWGVRGFREDGRDHEGPAFAPVEGQDDPRFAE